MNRKPTSDESSEAMYKLFDDYFILLRETKELADKIPNIESREQKIRAYKEYFAKTRVLRELEINVEDSMGALTWLR